MTISDPRCKAQLACLDLQTVAGDWARLVPRLTDWVVCMKQQSHHVLIRACEHLSESQINTKKRYVDIFIIGLSSGLSWSWGAGEGEGVCVYRWQLYDYTHPLLYFHTRPSHLISLAHVHSRFSHSRSKKRRVML